MNRPQRIETIQHIGARAERKVERELLDDLKRVTGKQNLLFELADACLPGKAQERNGWQYDSLGSKVRCDRARRAQRVYEILLKMLDRWNAHGI